MSIRETQGPTDVWERRGSGARFDWEMSKDVLVGPLDGSTCCSSPTRPCQSLHPSRQGSTGKHCGRVFPHVHTIFLMIGQNQIPLCERAHLPSLNSFLPAATLSPPTPSPLWLWMISTSTTNQACPKFAHAL